jgi:alpha-ketoglutarate-dependent taurine dioxygenase
MKNYIKRSQNIKQKDLQLLIDHFYTILIVENADISSLLPDSIIDINHHSKDSHMISDESLPWHTDGIFSKNPEKFTGLYAVNVDKEASPTYFKDMREAYRDLNDDLKQKLLNEKAKSKVLHYYNKSNFPYKFKDKSVFSKFVEQSNEHYLIRYDNEDNEYLYYSQIFTDTQYSEEIDKVIYNKYYTHYWKPGQLVLYNNRLVNHRRDFTSTDINRELKRLTFKDNIKWKW